MDSLRKIAAHLDLSHATVSAALRGLPGVKSSTRERVLRAAAQTGYRLNPLASALMGSMRRPRRAGFRGVLAALDFSAREADPADVIARERIMAGASSRAGELGFTVQEIVVGARGFEPEKLHEVLLARGIQGVVLVGTRRAMRPHDFDPGQLACVCAGTRRADLDSVLPDTRDAVEQARSRLRAEGFRKPAVILRDDAADETRAATRFEAGAHDSLVTDLDPPPSWVESVGALADGSRAIIRIDPPPGPSAFPGFDLRWELVGGKSVALLADKISRHNAHAASEVFTTLCPPLWRDGADVADVATETDATAAA